MKLTTRLGAEFLGTFVLVLGGTGSAVLAAKIIDPNTGSNELGIGILGVSLAFGLTVLVMAYGVGHISGGHFNPAVTIGLVVGKRFDVKDAIPYIVTQVVAAIVASATVLAIAAGQEGASADAIREGGLAANGYGDLSPQGYSLGAGLIAEIVLTAVFVIIIMGITSRKAPKGFAGAAIGLALTLIHLISIPVTNTSVNPARSTGPALLAGGEYLGQLWMFWVAPIVGGIIGALIYRFVGSGDEEGAEATA
jgi:aquaporin Z